MEDLHCKVKKWADSLQKDQLAGLAKDIQETIGAESSSEKLNTYIYKLLIFLSHAVSRCSKDNNRYQKDIFEISQSLCSKLTSVPDTTKYFTSIYFVIRYLLERNLYTEAQTITTYILPGSNVISNREELSEMYIKLAHLWRKTADDHLRSTSNFSENDYAFYKSIVKYELDIIKVTSRDYTKHILMRIDFHLDKLEEFCSKEKNTCIIDFRRTVLKYIEKCDISLGISDVPSVYRYTLLIVSKILFNNITRESLQSMENCLNDVYNIFESCFIGDKECMERFRIIKSLCEIFLKPMKIISKNFTTDFRICTKAFQNIIRKYKKSPVTIYDYYMIVRLFDPLFRYWEESIKNGESEFLKESDLMEMMNFIDFISKLLERETVENCKSCHDKACSIKRDLYNGIIMRLHYLNVCSRLSFQSLSEKFIVQSKSLVNDIISLIDEMKGSNCKGWSHVWTFISTILYNLGILCEKEFCEGSVFFFSLLSTCIANFEGIHVKNGYFALTNPLTTSLHRLCSVLYVHNKYRESMTIAALNALINHKDPSCKAFRMWTNIKQQCKAIPEIMKLTIVECLEKDEEAIGDILTIDYKDYDLASVTFHEIKVLSEAKVNLSEAIKSAIDKLRHLSKDPIKFAKAVQLLGYHLLSFQHKDLISKYIEDAKMMLRKVNRTPVIYNLLANLYFYEFVEKLQIISRTTKDEQDFLSFLSKGGKSYDQQIDGNDIIPAYPKLNVLEDANLFEMLKSAIEKWEKCFQCGIKQIVEDSEAIFTLNTIVVAGEYASLHKYSSLESKAWTLAYKLASEMKEQRIMIYVAGRCIAARYISEHWIETNERNSAALKESKDKLDVMALASFSLSLSDFYFENGKRCKAKELLEAIQNSPEISFGKNEVAHLLSLDMILQNYNDGDMPYRDYSLSIVKSLYSMIHLQYALGVEKRESRDKRLLGLNVLLSATNNQSLRMNSLLSFREITAHLLDTLKMAQTSGIILAVAECLKSLCYIDLSRERLDDCEVKLQGLEYILNIEMFKESVRSKAKKSEMPFPARIPSKIETVRDIPHNDASPILRKKIFVEPAFLSHDSCECYMCTNMSYKYLVFASIYIRAQLYALQRQDSLAIEHFYGAFKIRLQLFKEEDEISKKSLKLDSNGRQLGKNRQNILEYVVCLLDYSRFMTKVDPSKRERAFEIVTQAVRICRKFQLDNHPIYSSAMELSFEHRMKFVSPVFEYSAFTVPDVDDIETNSTKEDASEPITCVTPVTATASRQRVPRRLRTNSTQALFSVKKIAFDVSDEEEVRPPTPPPKLRRSQRRCDKK